MTVLESSFATRGGVAKLSEVPPRFELGNGGFADTNGLDVSPVEGLMKRAVASVEERSEKREYGGNRPESVLNDSVGQMPDGSALRPVFVAGYLVDSDGAVWSAASNWRGYGLRRMVPRISRDGYQEVRLTSDGRRLVCRVHQLVARAFHGERPSDHHQVRHLNGDCLDNRAANLAWGTARENAGDRTAHGRSVGGEVRKRAAALITHCKHGHEFTAENTRISHKDRGLAHRMCRACARAAWHRRNK